MSRLPTTALPVVLFILCFRSIAGASDAAVEDVATEPDVSPAIADETLTLNNDNPKLLWKMLSASLVILAIGGIGLVITKKFLPRILKISSRSGKKVSVAETFYLGPTKAVHLLKVGMEFFLIADTRQGLSLLGKVAADAIDTVETMDAREKDIQ